MVKGNVNNILIPNVTKVQSKEQNSNKLNEGDVSEFSKIVQKEISNNSGINLSVHAARRLKERNMDMNGDEYMKLKGAMDRLKEKGGRESLVVTKNGAYIVDVKNNTIVTAMDRESLKENIFTKIDSTILLD